MAGFLWLSLTIGGECCGGEAMWSSIPLSGGESPLGLDPHVAVAELPGPQHQHRHELLGKPLSHRFSSGAAVELFTTSLLVHLYLRGRDVG